MLGTSTHSSPPGYGAFFNTPIPGQDHHGGAAVFVRADVPIVPLQFNSPLQAVTVKVFLDKFYTFCSLYLPPGVPVTRSNLDGLTQELSPPFLLLEDLWDAGATNPREILIAPFIEDEGLEVLNSGNVTHFHSQTGIFTSINLSLCTSNSLLDFTWRVLPDLYGSDFFQILIESVNSEQRSRRP